jgi:hypothetical protein
MKTLTDQMKKKVMSLFKRTALWRWLESKRRDRYRPEKHYMRGPGPKSQHKGGMVLSGNAMRSPSRRDKSAG